MKKKIFTLLNKGMNRDLSISKAGESSAYENHNIRILARDNDSMLSVTNERGNKAINLKVGGQASASRLMSMLRSSNITATSAGFVSSDIVGQVSFNSAINAVDTTTITTQVQPGFRVGVSNQESMWSGDSQRHLVIFLQGVGYDASGNAIAATPSLVITKRNEELSLSDIATESGYVPNALNTGYESTAWSVKYIGDGSADYFTVNSDDDSAVYYELSLTALGMQRMDIRMSACVINTSSASQETSAGFTVETPALFVGSSYPAIMSSAATEWAINFGATSESIVLGEQPDPDPEPEPEPEPEPDPYDGTIAGILIGWNVLREHLVLFTKEMGESEPDNIYRVDYSSGNDDFTIWRLYHGDLNFDVKHPIESIVYYESDTIQKIYWVDGLNVLRMMNFMADSSEQQLWNKEIENGIHKTTFFDSNRVIDFGVKANITKDNSGSPRANGVAQYFLTYYNKHGQESGFVWSSDLVYLSPTDVGGAADGQNNNRVYLHLTNLDDRYTNFRIYSIVRTSYNGDVTAYLVHDGEIASETVVIDDAGHLTAMDASRLLFIGSQQVVPWTLEHKDQTLFLGDLHLSKETYGDVSAAIATHMRDENGMSTCIEFAFSDSEDASGYINDIPLEDDKGLYHYNNQLKYTSSEILSFKGGEKYRFALVFKDKNGIASEAFWIGDAENPLYPVVDVTRNAVRRIIAKCSIPDDVLSVLPDDFKTVQLMIAQASYADRSVKAQGLLNPTVFNVWDRYNERRYAAPSWLTRVRGAEYANRHFESIGNATSPTGEIACNYWENTTPTPYYILKDDNGSVVPMQENEVYDGLSDWDYHMLIYGFQMSFGAVFNARQRSLRVKLFILRVRFNDSNAKSIVDDIQFADSTYDSLWASAVEKAGDANEYSDPDGRFVISLMWGGMVFGEGDWNSATNSAYGQISSLCSYYGVDQYKMSEELFRDISGDLNNNHDSTEYFWNTRFASDRSQGKADSRQAADYVSSDRIPADRWWSEDTNFSGSTPAMRAAKYKKHLMFLDENVVTLDSPEIAYERTSMDNTDGLKLRVVGMAKLHSDISDYVVDASHGLLPGENLIRENFSGFEENNETRGLLAWPLWQETGLVPKESDPETGYVFPVDAHERSSRDYSKVDSPVLYWLHMFGRAGKIDGFTNYNEDGTEDNHSELHSKVFANLKFFDGTIYHNSTSDKSEYNLVSLREFHEVSSQYKNIRIGTSASYKNKIYNGYVDDSLMPPGTFKYPILFSRRSVDPFSEPDTAMNYYSAEPVGLSYASRPHAVMSLESDIWTDTDTGQKYYRQTILPYVYVLESEWSRTIPTSHLDGSTYYSGALIPWGDVSNSLENCVIITDLPGFTMSSYNPETGIGSFSFRDYTSLTYELAQKIHYAFRNARNHFGDEVVYALISAADANYLVDITSATWILHSIYINNAQVLAMSPSSVSGTIVNVNVVEGTLDSTQYTTEGVFSLDVGTETLSALSYPYVDYKMKQDRFYISPAAGADSIDQLLGGTKYVLIGEIYDDFANGDTRYGGTSEYAVENNKFIIAGPAYELKDVTSNTQLVANQGDTYFQRWDDLRTIPLSADDVNGVIDVASFMVETHINLDGRTDLQRGIKELASIKPESFGMLNPVYGQENNFEMRRDLDEDFERSNYESMITWSLQKADMAEVDEWTHVTLANVLTLDGDKGRCRAIRRYDNSLIAFQDKGIAEILFNSRTQLSTTNGVPVEIGNSGKVDGKRYITNKYGCTNKWSIVEGKDALYFVDNINKVFASFSGQGIRNISSTLGFSVFFRDINKIDPWNPDDFNNIVSFYDRIHSDVYLVTNRTDDMSCLVYNEALGQFSSFFDYGEVSMMTNIEDRFISYKNRSLWLQNEGLFCNFFGVQKDFWVTYRATPSPYSDKIWTNFEYRSDFFRVFDNDEYLKVDEQMGEYGAYQSDETFTKMLVWNEYQRTEELTIQKPFTDSYADVRKKFRIWRLDIPRAEITESNEYGFDRIRNPWINVRLKKEIADGSDEAKDLMQLHDVNVIYYE